MLWLFECQLDRFGQRFDLEMVAQFERRATCVGFFFVEPWLHHRATAARDLQRIAELCIDRQDVFCGLPVGCPDLIVRAIQHQCIRLIELIRVRPLKSLCVRYAQCHTRRFAVDRFVADSEHTLAGFCQ